MSLPRFNQINRRFPALKAPAQASPGQRPGLRNPWIAARPEGAQDPPPPFQGGRDEIWARYPGRCPGLVTSAPLARHRGCVLKSQLGISECMCMSFRATRKLPVHSGSVLLSILFMSGNTPMTEHEQGASTDLEQRAFQLSLFACLAIVVLAGGLALLMYPAVFSSRENAQNQDSADCLLRLLRAVVSAGRLHCGPPDHDSSPASTRWPWTGSGLPRRCGRPAPTCCPPCRTSIRLKTG